MGRTIQLEPVEITTPDPTAEEEERRRRARELASPILGALDGAHVALPEGGDDTAEASAAAIAAGAPDGRLEAQQAEAARVGAAYRAAGGQPAPSSERVAPQQGHAGTQRILTFDPEVRTAAPRTRIDDSQARGAADPSPAMGRALGSPSSPSAPRVPPSQPSGPAATSPAPGGVDRARLLEMVRAKAGGGRQPADHTGADVADAVRRPLHAIGAALSAASGRSPSQFRSLGDESRRREAQAQQIDARGAQQESAARLAEMRMRQQGEDAAARREAAAADRQIRADGVASLDRYRQQMADIRRQADEGLISQRQAAAAAIRLRSEREQAMEDPASELSRSEQEAFRQYVAGLPVQMRNMLGDIDVSGMNGRQVQETWRAYERHLGTVRHTGRPRSGTGGGGGRQQATQQALARRAQAAGMDQNTIDSYGRDANALRREVERRERAGGGDDTASPIPGLRIGPTETHRRAAGGVIGSVTDLRALRDEVMDFRTTQDLLNDFERLLGEASVQERAGNLLGTSPVMRDLENVQNTLALQGRGILGPGAITDQERALLMQLVPSIDLVRSSTTARQQLATMRRRRETRFNNYLDLRGFVVDPGYRVGGGGGGGGQQPQQRRTHPEWVRVPGGRWTRMRDAETYREAQRRAQAAGVSLEER